MSRHNIRRRLASVEARCHRPMISPEELAELVVGAPPEVFEEMFTHPLLKSPGAAKPSFCCRCGHTGPFSEKKPIQPARWVPKSKLNEGRVTVRQLWDALSRSTLAILDDALCLAMSGEPDVEVIVVDCLVCGHQIPQLLEPRGSPSI